MRRAFFGRRLSVDSFGAQLQAFARKTEEKLEDVDVAFKLSLFNRVSALTRVDTGRMRGNWQVTTGAPAQTEIERLRPRAATIAPNEAAKIKPFSATYLTNNVPYAPIWEERDGMMGRAIADARRILEEQVRDA